MNNTDSDQPKQLIFREHSSTKPCSSCRFDVYKKYSKTANRTLTTFANEMSEILKESMEHMDCLNLMVRGVCEPKTKNTSQLSVQSHHMDQRGDKGGLLKYKHVLKQDFSEPYPACTVASRCTKQPSLASEESQQKFNKHLVQHIQDMRQSGDMNKKPELATNAQSVVLMEIKRNKMDNASLLAGYNQERSVMESIKKHHRKLSKADKKSPTKSDVDVKSTQGSTEKTTKNKKQKGGQRKVKRKPSKSARDLQDRPLIERNLDEKSQIDGSQTTVKKGMRCTKLSRKYANENFLSAARKDRPNTEGDLYGGKKIKMQSDNKQDWCVIMHTQKPSKGDCKPNTCRITNILETITLKELEPLKAEYPRKDHIMEPMVQPENTLLHSLVNNNTKSLELLVDINNLQKKTFFKKPASALPQKNDSKMVVEGIKSRPTTVKEVKVKNKKVSKGKKERDVNYKPVVSSKEYQMYRKLTKNDAKNRLKKYMTDPGRSYKQEIIAMPVLVDFDKEWQLPDISEVNSKETVVPDDILKPYIYTNISTQVSKAQPAVLTVAIPNVKRTKDEPNNRMLESNKAMVQSVDEQPSVLVQRVITCKQTKKSPSPKHSLRCQTSEGSQLISFIVNKDQENSVNTLYSATKVSQSRKSSASGKVPPSPKRSTKAKPQAKSVDLKAAIDGIERKLKEIIDQPEKRNSSVMQNMELEMKHILSKMQINLDTPDFSIASSSTNSSVYGLDKCKSLLRSKTNVECSPKLINSSASSVQSKKLRPQSTKPGPHSATPSVTSPLYKESTVKLLKTIESQKIQTKPKESKTMKLDRKPMKQQQEVIRQLKSKPVILDLENEQTHDSIVEVKRPPRPPDLHVIMAPERDYNNTKKAKVENKDSMCAPIKFASPHANISIPKEIPSKTQLELQVVFQKNERTKPAELNESPKRGPKLILKMEDVRMESRAAEVKQKPIEQSQQKVNSEILNKWQTLEHPSMIQLNTQVEPNEIKEELVAKPNIIKPVNEVTIKPKEVTDGKQLNESVGKARPFTADSVVAVKAQLKTAAEVCSEKNVSELKKTLEAESKGLCNDVNEVLHKIHEQNVVHLNTQQMIEGSEQNIEMQIIRSEEFWTPFMQAVKTFRKEDHNNENLYDFMKEKGHIRGSTELIRHRASMNCIASEIYVTKRMMQVKYKDWTDSDLNVQNPAEDTDVDTSTEQSLPPKPAKKCLRRMTYHERLSEMARRKLGITVPEAGTEIRCESVATATVEGAGDETLKHIQFGEENIAEIMGEIAKESDLQLMVRSAESFKYDKVLTCLYGLMFMTIFCGLNLKYSCA